MMDGHKLLDEIQSILIKLVLIQFLTFKQTEIKDYSSEYNSIEEVYETAVAVGLNLCNLKRL
jgi:DNA-directed RNA polymerase alpha subunit